jgi:hypothetical protein
MTEIIDQAFHQRIVRNVSKVTNPSERVSLVCHRIDPFGQKGRVLPIECGADTGAWLPALIT